MAGRGLLEGYDAKTGKHLWRTYTIPAKGEPGSETWEGDSALTGGGSSWVTGTYDPELDLVYWGVGNPSPRNPRARKLLQDRGGRFRQARARLSQQWLSWDRS